MRTIDRSRTSRRKRAGRASVELDEAIPDTAATPERAAEQEQARRRLEAAVRRLPVGQRLVVTLALEGFSPEEVASVLGIGVSAASVRLHRAKAALQDMIREVPR